MTTSMACKESTQAYGTTVHRLFEVQAARTPGAVAVTLDGQNLTYSELNRRANQVAHRLRARGVGPEVPVGICLERSLDLVAGMLGILKAGGVYVPLDPAYPPDRLGFMLADTRAPVLLTREWLHGILPAHHAHQIDLDEDVDVLAGESEENPAVAVEPHHLAYVIYTSGSTGQPKGVCVAHEAAVQHFVTMQARWELSAADRVLAFASFSFDASLEQVFPTLYSGATVVLRGAEGWSASEFSRTARALRLTVADLPTAYWDQWVQAALDEQGHRQGQLTDLRLVAIGGEAARVETVRRWGETVLRSIRLVNAYGPTEATITASVHELTPGLDRTPLERVPIGRPLPNRTMYILDQSGAPAPNGEPGELHIGGAGLARGYLNRPDLTAEKFIPDPFDGRPGARLYRTGDLVRALPDGTIEFLGRVDRQVKVRGFRIELGEIEARLSQHPTVQDTVVLAREDVPGDKRLVAYVVTRMAVSLKDLQSFLGEQLPPYMLPSAVVFLDRLPLSPNGKVDRTALPAPDATRPELVEAYVAPRTPVEEALARIWAQVLRVERVGVHDAFLDLGGDSLLAMQAVARAGQVGLRFTPEQLYRCQTIAALAAETSHVSADSATVTAEQGPVTGAVPLTPALSRFLAATGRSDRGSIESLSFAMQEAADAVLLERAVRHVIAHHDALRLRFRHDEAGWSAVNAADEQNQVFQVVDLAGRGEAAQQASMAATLAAMAAAIDLSRGPLIKAALCIPGTDCPGHLVLLIHHLAVDAYSEPIILQDLETAYRQLRQGRAPRLPAKTTSFKSWAEHLAASARSDELLGELRYWLSQPWSRVRCLPLDFSGADQEVGRAVHVRVVLGAEETSALLYDAAPALDAPVRDLLLTALARVFGAWTGSDTLLIRLIGHGREPLFDDVDLSRTVGWLTSAYPVLLDARGAAHPAGAVRAVAERLRQVPAHGLGYGLLRNLGPRTAAAQLDALPQPQVHLNYLGRIDDVHAGPSLFAPMEELLPSAPGPLVRTYGDVRLRARIESGELHLRVGYHERAYRRETIVRLANGVLAALREIVAAGRQRAPTGAGVSQAVTAGASQAVPDSSAPSERRHGEAAA